MWTDFLTPYLSLNTIWFLLVGILFTGYAVLDGFDLGVGMLNLWGRSDRDRRLLYNAIGPVWDGNEVWLVTGGGALFAAFPVAYATVFSGFYLVFILLLFAIILRAVAIEFRSKEPMKWWRRMWDYTFCLSSFLSSLLIGTAIGNIAWGIPLDQEHYYAGTFGDLFHPYALWIGVTTVALFAMHGSIYIVLKTEGDLQKQFRQYVGPLVGLFLFCYGVASLATIGFVPHMTAIFFHYPATSVVFVVNILIFLNIPRQLHRGNELAAFLSSCGGMVTLMVVFGLGIFPHLVYAIPVSNSLSIYLASSSQKSLSTMLLIAVLGLPLVLAYTVSIYWIFRGKVTLGEDSY